MLDFTSSTTSNFLKAEGGSNPGGKKRDYFKWSNGDNNLRFLRFKHRMNQYDVLRGICGEEHLGQEALMLAIPVWRIFVGTNPKRMMLAWPEGHKEQWECPLWKQWFNPVDPATGEPYDKETAKAWRQKHKNLQPQPAFLANVVDMDRPENGVSVVSFSRSDWLGPRSNTRPPRQIAYGIFNALEGYSPEVEEDDNGEVVLVSAGGGGGLAPFDGFVNKLREQGMELYGHNGLDVVVPKSPGNFGLQLDTAKPISVRGPKDSLKLDPKEYEPMDILMMPSSYPGYVSGQNAKMLNDTCQNFVTFAKAQKDATKTPANTEAEGQRQVAQMQAAPQIETPTPAEEGQAAFEEATGGAALPSVPAAEPLTAPQTAPEVETPSETEETPIASQAKAEPASDALADLYAAGLLSKSRKRKHAEGQIVMAIDVTDKDEAHPKGTSYLGTVSKITDDGVNVALTEVDQLDDKAKSVVVKYAGEGTNEFAFPAGDVMILDRNDT